jgi:replicative DNA helicase
MSDDKAGERLSGALQENILTVLCFDKANAALVRAAVGDYRTFESSVFREVAKHAIDFIDLYKEPIGDHLPDHLEDILKGPDERKAKTYERLLVNLGDSRDTVNSAYVVDSLQKFVRQQNLKAALVAATEAMEDGRIDLAEVEMQRGLSSQVVTFAPGFNMSDADSVTALLEDSEEPGFHLNIPEFDRRGIFPRRKELLMFIAPRGRGKSWFATHCAKMALLQRWSVLVVTLEMSEKRYAVRVLQSFFSVSQREAAVRVTRFAVSKDGRLSDLVYETLDSPALTDDDTKAMLSRRVKREFRKRKPLMVKQFPTGGLDLVQLRAYLDGLERFEGWTPDLLIVDYPDLMKHDVKNKRIELGQLVEGIRGICVERNIAGVVPSQGNRASETATTVTQDQAAEDISKVATADVVITYSQTRAERKLGLARLLADKVRNGEDKVSVLISQAYAVGQFALDSIRLDDDYWDIVDVGDDDGPRGRGDRD